MSVFTSNLCRVNLGLGFTVEAGWRRVGPGKAISAISVNLGFEFRVSSFGFRASVFRIRVSGFGLRASGFGLRVLGFGLRVLGFGLRVRPDARVLGAVRRQVVHE